MYAATAEATLEASQNDAIRIASVSLLDDRGAPADPSVLPGESLVLRATFEPKTSAGDVTFGFLVYRSTDNLLVYDGHFTNAEIGIREITANKPFQVDFAFRANLTRGHYRVVTRIYDNILQRFLAEVCPPATFGVQELQTWAGIAYLDVRPVARPGEPDGQALMEQSL